MTPICAMFFLVGYWTDKFLLLKGSARPPHVDESLAMQSIYFLLLAIILHCVIGTQMLGQQSSFPSNSVSWAQSAVDGILNDFNFDDANLTLAEVHFLSDDSSCL